MKKIFNWFIKWREPKQDPSKIVVPSDVLSVNDRESIEFLVNLYTQIATRQKDLGVSKELANIQTILLHEMKRRNISVFSSFPGVKFDPINMIVAPFPPILTNNREKENLVAGSIVPLFTLKDKGKIDNILLHKEQVVLYQFSESCESMHPQSVLLAGPNQLDCSHAVVFPAVVGHLILIQYDEISDIYDVYEGCNVYGTSPTEADGKHCHTIAVANEFMKPEHFEICDHKAKLLSGSWNIDYEGNKISEVEINNGMKIILSKEISFVLIEK